MRIWTCLIRARKARRKFPRKRKPPKRRLARNRSLMTSGLTRTTEERENKRLEGVICVLFARNEGLNIN
jgi:hypothetical protein